MGIRKAYFQAGDESAWKEQRNSLIASGKLGGSMVGIAAGCSSYKSRIRMWAEIKGLLSEPDLTKKESVRNGKDHEEYVARRFCELSGKDVHRVNYILTNDEYPHLFASIDRKISNEESGLECKTANAYMKDKFTDEEFPKTYYAQVCSYLAVSGLKRWYLCIWCMGIFVKTYLLTTDRDDMANKPEWITAAFYVSPEELMACEKIACDFIESLNSNEPPPLDGSDDEIDALKELYPRGNGLMRKLGNDIDLLIQERNGLKKEIEAYEERVNTIENTIRAALGSNEIGVTNNFKISYKNTTTSRVNNDCIKAVHGGKIPSEYYKTSEGRTMRITKVKKS